MQGHHGQNPGQLSLADSIFEHSREGIMVVDAGGFIVDINPAFERITGYAKDEVIGKTPKLLASGRQDAAFYAEMWQTLAATGEWRGEIINRRKSGELFAQLLHIRCINDADGRLSHYISTFLDLQALGIPADQIERMIYRDCLTGLPNLRAFATQVAQALRPGGQHTRLAICVIEFPEFPDFKTMLGATAFDEMSWVVAHRLERTLRPEGVLARAPDGRFWLACRSESAAAFEDCLHPLLAEVAAPIEVKNLPLDITVRVGVAFASPEDNELPALLAAAERALAPWPDTSRAAGN